MTLPATEHAWLRGNYDARLLTPEASPRRYYRSSHPDTRGWLRVYSPSAAPREMTDFYLGLGVRVPRIGPQQGEHYLVEDLGDVHLCHRPELAAYRQVLDTHRRYYLAELPHSHPNHALALDADLFARELQQFADEFLAPRLSRSSSTASLEPIHEALSRLAQAAAAGPQALQHRDLHSRNVLLVAGGIALIDHQDTRRGPMFYDLASLATDAYVDLDGGVREALDAEVHQLGGAAGLNSSELRSQYRATALQRVLKALGTFGKLLNAGRTDYESAAERASQHALTLLDEDHRDAVFCGPTRAALVEVLQG